jgi:hypothetical protein
MKRAVGLLCLAAALAGTAGCSRGAIGGAAGGVLGAGAGYEYNLKRQRDRIDSDLKAGTIDQKEHDIRMSQIERDSLIQ